MKRSSLLAMLAILCFCLCACGQTQDDSEKWSDVAEMLREAAGTKCSVEVSKTGYVSVTVNIPASDDLALFGTRAYHIIEAAKKMLADEGDYVLRINKETTAPKYDGKDFMYITASGSGKYFCRYFDKREGTLPARQQRDCASVDDLAAFFPNLQIRLMEERNLTQEELAVWDAVWAKLNAEPDREESEIYESIAPDFGMSAEELSDYIGLLMEKVYS